MTTPRRRHSKATILRGVEKAAAEHRASIATRDHLIAVAVKYGHSQTEVARVAGMSQAHVSRVVATFKRLGDERRAQAASRKRHAGGTV